MEEKTDLKDKEPTLTCIANITSKYQYSQELWFMSGRHILSGTVECIRGDADAYGNVSMELDLYHTAGDVGANFWVKEDDCFPTRESLVNAIINSY